MPDEPQTQHIPTTTEWKHCKLEIISQAWCFNSGNETIKLVGVTIGSIPFCLSFYSLPCTKPFSCECLPPIDKALVVWPHETSIVNVI